MSPPAATPSRQLGPLTLYAWSLLVGAGSGLGAVVFRGLIALFHNLFFLGQWSFNYDANIHTPASPWGALVILTPVVGALGVAFLVGHFAPEAKGHGVPEVMEAVYYHKGIIRPVVGVIKALASALSIGSGGSVGREGPFVQIGSAFGSTVGQFLGLPAWQTITLIAAGGGAGIAATFNTPIGGVLFAVEIMLQEVSARTLVPVTIATVTASYISRMVFGVNPSFKIPALEISATHPTGVLVMLFYPGLGILTGLLSLAYIRSLYACEDFFDNRVPGNYYTRHMLGMFAVGLIIYALFRTTGRYYVEGVGYATVQDVLSGDVTWFLLVLAALKLAVTSLTLGSGASGGVFSPGLYLGATVGGVYGLAIHQLFPGLPIDPAAFAVAGMAGVIGGSTGAAMTAVVMIFEMTRDYRVIIPITITVAISYGLRTILHRNSIYTEKVVRRGHEVPVVLQTNLFHLKKTRDMMDRKLAFLPVAAPLSDFARAVAEQPDVACFLVEGPEGLVGFLTRDVALRSPQKSDGAVSLGDLADRRFVTVREHTPLLGVMAALRDHAASVAIVTGGEASTQADAIRGVITAHHIAAAMIDGMELYSGET